MKKNFGLKEPEENHNRKVCDCCHKEEEICEGGMVLEKILITKNIYRFLCRKCYNVISGGK
jgi:hypothetical protein